MPQDGQETRVPKLLGLAILLHALAYFVLVPPWMGEDEPWQYEYAEQIARGALPQLGAGAELTLEDVERRPHTQLQTLRRFPNVPEDDIAVLQTEIMHSMREHGFWRHVDWAQEPSEPRHFGQVQHNMTATNQPPLFYLVTGLWLRLCPAQDHAVRLRFARLLSLFAYLATVWLAYRAACLAFDDGQTAILCAVLCAWLPIHARQAAVLNNDVFGKLFATLAFFFAVRLIVRGGGLRGFMPLLFACAFGLASKTTAAASLGVALGALLLARQRSPESIPSRARGPWLRKIVVGILVLAVGAAALFIWTRQHNPAVPASFENLRERMAHAFRPGALHELWRTSIGTFAWSSRALPGAVYLWIGRATALVALLSLATFIRREAHAERVVTLAWLALVLQLLLLVLRGVSVGRYLLPAAVPFALILAAGFTQPWPRRFRTNTLRAGVIFALVVDAFFLAGLVRHGFLEWSA